MSDRLRAYQEPTDSRASHPAPPTRLSGQRLPASEPGPAEGISLDTVLARMHALPGLSEGVLRALQLADRDSISSRDLVAVINADLRFSSRVVKAANLPCYKLKRPVDAVSEAVLLLGTDAIREVVLIAAARDIFYRPLPGYGMSARDLWAHSLACGAASELVAEITGYGNRTEAFIGGLAHDVGKIVLDTEMQAADHRLARLMESQGCSYIEAERAVLGYDHCDIGARVLRTWGLPQHIVQAVALHRKPVVTRQTVPLAGCIHLGEALCSMAGIGIGREGLHMTLDTQVLSDFKFSEEMADLVMSRLVDRMAAGKNLFLCVDPVPSTGS